MTKMTLNFADRLKVADWLREHKDLPTNLEAIATACFSDTGVRASVHTIRSTAKEINVSLPIRRNTKTRNLNDGFTRDAILAKSIRELAVALGHKLAYEDELGQIVARRTPSIVEPAQ